MVHGHDTNQLNCLKFTKTLMVHEHDTNQLNCLKFVWKYNEYVHHKIFSLNG